MPEAAQAWQGPTQRVFPFGFGGFPGFWTCFAAWSGQAGEGGVVGKKGMGWSPEFVLALLLGLVLPGCSGLGSVPVLGGSYRR